MSSARNAPAARRAGGGSYFSPASFRFLRDLARHNDREWFQAHKADYETHLRQPFLRLISDLAEPLRDEISAEIVANPKPLGGSLFRIHRDTRFAKDKRPYKEHSGASFYHAATRAQARGGDGDQGTMGRLDAPGFYLHLAPGDGASFCGGGLWHPQPATLKRIRDYLLNNPVSWQQATRNPAFLATFGGLGGESLSRPPRGYPIDHPLLDDLKRKDYLCASPLDESQLSSPDLPALLIARFRLAAPLVDWLCGALDLEF